MKDRIILLVEDNPDDVLLTTHALEESHVCNRIVHMPDGVEALDYLFARGRHAERDPADLPALVLLDLNMPKLHGLEVLTTSQEEQDLTASYDLGANSYVRKPVDFEQFTEAARHLGMYWMLLNELAPPPAG